MIAEETTCVGEGAGAGSLQWAVLPQHPMEPDLNLHFALLPVS